MCRMFAYVGSSHAELNGLYIALKKAAMHDRTLTWIDDKQHRDGWGCVILNGSNLIYHRSMNPIFNDAFSIPRISGKTYAIFHARKARKGTKKIGLPVFSHPFMAETDSSTIFLAHNGSLTDPIPDTKVDSEIALKMITERGSLKRALGTLKKRDERGLNLLVLTIHRTTREAKLEYLNYWNKKTVKMEKYQYYRLYKKRLKAGSAVFSSTLGDWLGGTKTEYGKVMALVG